MYYMAENLEVRHGEIAQRISNMTGQPMEEAKKEVDAAIQRLFYWGAYADKYGGTVQVGRVCGQYRPVLRTCFRHLLFCSFSPLKMISANHRPGPGCSKPD